MTRDTRTIVGVFAIIGLIMLLGLVVMGLANVIAPWPIWAQSLFYLVAGLVWLLPLKPLLIWMNKP